MVAADSIQTSEMFVDLESRAPTPSLRKEPKPVKVEGAPPPHQDSPEVVLHEMVELLTRALGGGEEDPDLSTLSVALKIEPGWSDLQKRRQLCRLELNC